MRKIWILALTALAVSYTNAQEVVDNDNDDTVVVNNDEGFKPVAGDKTLEVQFAPLGGTPISIGGIRGRMFTTANSAYRLNAFLGYTSESNITQNEDADADQEQLKDKETSFTIALAPGIEKHFPGTSRISPYIGAELPLAWNTSANKSEVQVADEVEWSKTKNGYFEIGLNALAGVDFYFTKSLYLGTEFGFGMQYHKDSKEKVSLSEGDAPEPNGVGTGSTFTLAPNVNGQIRLGFVF